MRARACGKLILCGEHAVVYNHPAIALPLELYTTVEVEEGFGPLTVDHELWSPRHEIRMEEALDHLFPKGNAEIQIRSELPVGVGLGSSAALSVAVCRAIGLEGDALMEKALELENIFHGDASGLDIAVAARGEALWYVKGKPLQPVPLPPCAIVVLDSGTAGDTKVLVQSVADRYDQLEDTIEDIGALVHAARAVLEDPTSLGELLTENHGLLKQLGVSTPALDQLVDLALGAGAYGAKLSGAGGGGVVIALTDDPDHILKSAASAGVEAWLARSGS
ncbi:MAG: mevalonate kinase [Myxococcales bacterium]|nr:mevalonate kinase [Myxococcales bacterium]